MSNTGPPKVLEVLKDIVKSDIDNFEVIVHEGNKKGEGFLGEIVFITMREKNSDQNLNFAVKQAFDKKTIRDAHQIRKVYLNEIYFYTETWPILERFQERISPKYRFQKIPKCFATVSEEFSEKLVLENLKYQGFEVYDKKKPLDKEHFELIFKEYGKFHAVSFAYKALHPDSYARLVSGTTNLFLSMATRDYFEKGNIYTHETCLKGLVPGTDDAVIERYKLYPEICNKLFLESVDCATKYAVIVHGDCWSNNMMFKYDETRKVTDVRFLDFQMSTEGSPCCDLSYCIYSGAPKEVLNNLDYYLQGYHDILSETLRQFECDSNKIYPLRELKADWKRYCKMGFTMALFIWRLKTTYEGEIKDLNDMIELGEEELKSSGYDEEEYKRITRDLILHMHENGFL
ncbi:uncharacterized protein LOC108907556 [Anoplophora glabripennis]|uniref:uncharacterized protein LOC108907556 n=1 Tax=Anoplophora glabripennis TaxID=217634 RepID=UPI000874658F|nr:uncharacterized protein LOC108907556 [Anoplophora glabripennis]